MPLTTRTRSMERPASAMRPACPSPSRGTRSMAAANATRGAASARASEVIALRKSNSASGSTPPRRRRCDQTAQAAAMTRIKTGFHTASTPSATRTIGALAQIANDTIVGISIGSAPRRHLLPRLPQTRRGGHPCVRYGRRSGRRTATGGAPLLPAEPAHRSGQALPGATAPPLPSFCSPGTG